MHELDLTQIVITLVSSGVVLYIVTGIYKLGRFREEVVQSFKNVDEKFANQEKKMLEQEKRMLEKMSVLEDKMSEKMSVLEDKMSEKFFLLEGKLLRLDNEVGEVKKEIQQLNTRMAVVESKISDININVSHLMWQNQIPPMKEASGGGKAA